MEMIFKSLNASRSQSVNIIVTKHVVTKSLSCNLRCPRSRESQVKMQVGLVSDCRITKNPQTVCFRIISFTRLNKLARMLRLQLGDSARDRECCEAAPFSRSPTINLFF